MDFRSMKRKQLQALCKKHGLPANKSNLEMANVLASLLQANENPKSEGNDEVGRKNSCEDGVNAKKKRKKKVRFSPEVETKEYQPSVFATRRGRRRTILDPVPSNSEIEGQTQRSGKVVGGSPPTILRSRAQKGIGRDADVAVVMPTVGKKRGRGSEAVESVRVENVDVRDGPPPIVERQLRSRKVVAKVSAEVGGEKNNTVRNPRKRRDIESTNELVDGVCEENVSVKDVKPRNALVRVRRNVRKDEGSDVLRKELGKAETIGRSTRSRTKLQELTSSGNEKKIETVEDQDACEKVLQLEGPLKDSRGNALKRKFSLPRKELASEIPGGQVIESAKGIRRSKRNVRTNTRSETMLTIDTSQAEVVSRTSRLGAQSSGTGPAVKKEGRMLSVREDSNGSADLKEFSKALSRNTSRRKSVAPQRRSVGSVVQELTEETRKRPRNSDLEVVPEAEASVGFGEEIEKAALPSGLSRPSRSKKFMLNSNVATNESESVGTAAEQVSGKDGHVTSKILRSSRSASRHGSEANSSEVTETAGDDGKLGQLKDVQILEKKTSVILGESLVENRSPGCFSKRKSAGPTLPTENVEENSLREHTVISEAKFVQNISCFEEPLIEVPCNFPVPEATRDQSCSSLNSSEEVSTVSDRRNASKSRSEGKRRTDVVDFSTVPSHLKEGLYTRLDLEKTLASTSSKLVSLHMDQKTIEIEREPAVVHEETNNIVGNIEKLVSYHIVEDDLDNPLFQASKCHTEFDNENAAESEEEANLQKNDFGVVASADSSSSASPSDFEEHSDLLGLKNKQEREELVTNKDMHCRSVDDDHLTEVGIATPFQQDEVYGPEMSEQGMTIDKNGHKLLCHSGGESPASRVDIVEESTDRSLQVGTDVHPYSCTSVLHVAEERENIILDGNSCSVSELSRSKCVHELKKTEEIHLITPEEITDRDPNTLCDFKTDNDDHQGTMSELDIEEHKMEQEDSGNRVEVELFDSSCQKVSEVNNNTDSSFCRTFFEKIEVSEGKLVETMITFSSDLHGELSEKVSKNLEELNIEKLDPIVGPARCGLVIKNSDHSSKVVAANVSDSIDASLVNPICQESEFSTGKTICLPMSTLKCIKRIDMLEEASKSEITDSKVEIFAESTGDPSVEEEAENVTDDAADKQTNTVTTERFDMQGIPNGGTSQLNNPFGLLKLFPDYGDEFPKIDTAVRRVSKVVPADCEDLHGTCNRVVDTALKPDQEMSGELDNSLEKNALQMSISSFAASENPIADDAKAPEANEEVENNDINLEPMDTIIGTKPNDSAVTSPRITPKAREAVVEIDLVNKNSNFHAETTAEQICSETTEVFSQFDETTRTSQMLSIGRKQWKKNSAQGNLFTDMPCSKSEIRSKTDAVSKSSIFSSNGEKCESRRQHSIHIIQNESEGNTSSVDSGKITVPTKSLAADMESIDDGSNSLNEEKHMTDSQEVAGEKLSNYEVAVEDVSYLSRIDFVPVTSPLHGTGRADDSEGDNETTGFRMLDNAAGTVNELNEFANTQSRRFLSSVTPRMNVECSPLSPVIAHSCNEHLGSALFNNWEVNLIQGNGEQDQVKTSDEEALEDFLMSKDLLDTGLVKENTESIKEFDGQYSGEQFGKAVLTVLTGTNVPICVGGETSNKASDQMAGPMCQEIFSSYTKQEDNSSARSILSSDTPFGEPEMTSGSSTTAGQNVPALYREQFGVEHHFEDGSNDAATIVNKVMVGKNGEQATEILDYAADGLSPKINPGELLEIVEEQPIEGELLGITKEQLNEHPFALSQTAFMGGVDPSAINDQCENKRDSPSTEAEEVHSSHKFDCEFQAAVDSKDVVDLDTLDDISPFRYEIADGFRAVSAVGGPDHDDIGKSRESALQSNLTCQDAGELQDSAMIIEEAAMPVAEEQHGEQQHQMKEEIGDLKSSYRAGSDDPYSKEGEDSKQNIPVRADNIPGSSDREDHDDGCTKYAHSYVQLEKLTSLDRAEVNPFDDAAEVNSSDGTASQNPNNSKENAITDLTNEDVIEAIESNKDVLDLDASVEDKCRPFSNSAVGQDIPAQGDQRCGLKSLSPQKASSQAQKDITNNLFGKPLNSSVMKRKNGRIGLIQGTPQKLTDHYDMKENAPSTKRKHIGDTAPKTLSRRRALEDIRKN